MKRILLLALVAFSALMGEKIVVGATPVPHAEILELVKDDLAKAGYELDIKVFNDYILPNKALWDKDLDANFMQHEPYLREFNAMNGTRLEPVFGVHLEPMGAYSKKIKSLDELKAGDKIAIPNDPTNESRALDLLAKHGLIELDTSVHLRTPMDITKNPKNLEFLELEAPTLPRTLGDVSLAVINSNFAMSANLNPMKDALFTEEGKGNPYTNIIVVRGEQVYSDKSKALGKVIKSDKVKNFILEKYKGAVVPSF